jgi:hypothetical protein
LNKNAEGYDSDNKNQAANLCDQNFDNCYEEDIDVSMVQLYEKHSTKVEKIRNKDKDHKGEPEYTFLNGFKRYQEDFSNKVNSLKETHGRRFRGDDDVGAIKSVLEKQNSEFRKRNN